jgi:hypothetical protein
VLRCVAARMSSRIAEIASARPISSKGASTLDTVRSVSRPAPWVLDFWARNEKSVQVVERKSRGLRSQPGCFGTQRSGQGRARPCGEPETPGNCLATVKWLEPRSPTLAATLGVSVAEAGALGKTWCS